MPKMTAKYSRALGVARLLKIEFTEDQESLYSKIQSNGWMWDSKAQIWMELAEEPADEPTEMIMLRVWTDAEITNEVADLVQGAMKFAGCRLLERSELYRCRPPKQLEGRIYLKFLPPEKGKTR